LWSLSREREICCCLEGSGVCFSQGPPWDRSCSTGPSSQSRSFFRNLFPSELDSELVSARPAHYRLCLRILIPVDSPSDKRDRSCSGNRGLGIGIRAYSGRFCLSERVRTTWRMEGGTSASAVPGDLSFCGNREISRAIDVGKGQDIHRSSQIC
jgi:hypothetical protein